MSLAGKPFFLPENIPSLRMTRNKAGIAALSHTRLHEKADEVSPPGGCDIRKAPKRQRLSNAFYSAEGALKSYETAFVPVAQMDGALSDAFFHRKYLFSVEESYKISIRCKVVHGNVRLFIYFGRMPC